MLLHWHGGGGGGGGGGHANLKGGLWCVVFLLEILCFSVLCANGNIVFSCVNVIPIRPSLAIMEDIVMGLGSNDITTLISYAWQGSEWIGSTQYNTG